MNNSKYYLAGACIIFVALMTGQYNRLIEIDKGRYESVSKLNTNLILSLDGKEPRVMNDFSVPRGEKYLKELKEDVNDLYEKNYISVYDYNALKIKSSRMYEKYEQEQDDLIKESEKRWNRGQR